MKNATVPVTASLALIMLLAAPGASAGPYGDDMAKCLVNSTTALDRTQFIRWMFAAMALHPDVKSMSRITDQQHDDLNKAAGLQFTRLLTETCRSPAQLAIKFEGAQTITTAFNLFGQVAARELFSDPAVAGGLSGLKKYMDEGKLKDLMAVTPETKIP